MAYKLIFVNKLQLSKLYFTVDFTAVVQYAGLPSCLSTRVGGRQGGVRAGLGCRHGGHRAREQGVLIQGSQGTEDDAFIGH